MSSSPSATILGAGISGLSTAYALQKCGFNVTIYEERNQPGGVIQTHHSRGWQIEEGPNTMLVREQKIWNLLDELDLNDHIVKPGDEAGKRFIIRNGKMCTAPMSVWGFLTSDLLSASAKLRLLKEPFAARSSQGDESIARYICRRLGPELLDYTINPFVSGIYAGDPEELSIKHTFNSLFEMEQQYGSISMGFLKRDKDEKTAKRNLISFENGMQQLPAAIAHKLVDSVKLDSTIKQISKSGDGWQLSINQPSGNITQTADAVVSTIPTYKLPNILEEANCQKLINKLAQVKYAPMSILVLGFERSQIEHPLDGFGMLIPQKEPFSLLGCLFSSSLFEGRAPKRHELLTCFIGGARHPELASLSTDALIDEILPQLRKLLGVQGSPVFQHHTFWEKAIPQYTVGYDEYLNAINQIEEQNPGLFLSGNYRGGVSVPDCILNGLEIGEKAAAYLLRSNHSK